MRSTQTSLLHANRLLSLARALAAACDAVEVESIEAAELRADLAAIIAGCELIATEDGVADHDRAVAA